MPFRPRAFYGIDVAIHKVTKVSSPITARRNCIGKRKDCYSYRSWRRAQSIPSTSLRLLICVTD